MIDICSAGTTVYSDRYFKKAFQHHNKSPLKYHINHKFNNIILYNKNHLLTSKHSKNYYHFKHCFTMFNFTNLCQYQYYYFFTLKQSHFQHQQSIDSIDRDKQQLSIHTVIHTAGNTHDVIAKTYQKNNTPYSILTASGTVTIRLNERTLCHIFMVPLDYPSAYTEACIEGHPPLHFKCIVRVSYAVWRLSDHSKVFYCLTTRCFDYL